MHKCMFRLVSALLHIRPMAMVTEPTKNRKTETEFESLVSTNGKEMWAKLENRSPV